MNDSNFGEMLKFFRSRIGLSQRSLAAKAGINTSHISLIERGKRNTTRTIALRLANILKLSQKERDIWLIRAGFIPPSLQGLASDGIAKLIEDITRYNSPD